MTTSFRDLMAAVPAPVGIITSAFEGEVHGCTVTAFCSLSMDPPLILVALGNGSSTLKTIRQSEKFGFNMLSVDQVETSNIFATNGADKFANVAWELDYGSPKLIGSPGWLACETTKIVEGGDHAVVFGKILNLELIEDPAKERLLYHQRNYCKTVPLD